MASIAAYSVTQFVVAMVMTYVLMTVVGMVVAGRRELRRGVGRLDWLLGGIGGFLVAHLLMYFPVRIGTMFFVSGAAIIIIMFEGWRLRKMLKEGGWQE